MATSKETKSSMFLAFSIFILPLVKCQGPQSTPGGLNFGGRDAVGNVFHPQGGIISVGRDINYGLAIGTGIDSGRAGSGPTGHFGNVAAADNALATPGTRFATGNGINYGLEGRGLGTGISVGAGLVPQGPFGSSTNIDNAIDMPYANVGHSPGIDHTFNERGPGPGTRFGVGGNDPRGSSSSVFNMPSARSSDSYGMNYELERRAGSLIGVSGSGHPGNFDLGGSRSPVKSGSLPGHTSDNGYAITSSTGHEPDKVYLVYEGEKTIGESNVVGRSEHISKERGSSYFDSHGGVGGNQVKNDLDLNNYRYQTRSDDAIGSDYIDDMGSEFGYQGGDTANGQNRRQYDEGYTNEFELGVENDVYESIPQYSDETGERELGYDYNIEGEENDYSYETVYEDIEGVDDWVEDDTELSDAKYGYGLYDPYDYSSSTEDYDIKTIYIDLKEGESIPTHYSEENLFDSYSNHSNSFSGYRDQMHDNDGSTDHRTDDNRSKNGYDNGRRSTDDDFYDDDDDYENIAEGREHGGRRGQGNGHGHGDSREHNDRTERRRNSQRRSDRREYEREGYDHFSDDTRGYGNDNDRRGHRHGHDSARSYSAREGSGQEHRHESSREHREHHGSIREHGRNTEIIGHGRGDRGGHDRRGYDHVPDSRREHDEDDDRIRQRHGHSSTREDDDREERTGYGQTHGGIREQRGHDERRENGHGHGGIREDSEHAVRRGHGHGGRREHDRRQQDYDHTREYEDDDDDDRRGHRRVHDSARAYSAREGSGQDHGHGSTREHSEHHERKGHSRIRQLREHTLRIGNGRGDRREHDRRRHDHVPDNRREYNEDYDRRRYRHGHGSPREDDDREERTGYGQSRSGIREQSGHNERIGNGHGHGVTREHGGHAERRGYGRGDRREHDRTGHGHDQESTRDYRDGNRREHRHGHDSAREYSQRERSGQGHSHGSTIEHENRREFGRGHGGFREYRERAERRDHGGRREHGRGGRHSHFRDSSRDDSDDRSSHSHGVSREYHGHDEERVHGPGGRRDNDHRRSLNIGHVGTAEHDERTYTRRYDHGLNSTRNFWQDDRRGQGHDYHTQGHSGLSQHDDREYRIRHGHNLGDNIAQRHEHFEGNSHDRGRSSHGHGRRREQYARDDRRGNGNVNGEIYGDNAYRERQSQSHSSVNHEYDDRRESNRGIVDPGPIVRTRGRHRNFHRELHNSGSSHEGRREHIDHENFRGRGHDANGRRRVAENSRGVHIQGPGDRNSNHVEQNRVRGSFHRDRNAIRFSAYARQKQPNTGRKPRHHYNRENPSQLQHKRKDNERKKQVTSTKQHKKPAPRPKLLKVDGNARHPIRRVDRRPKKKTYPRRRLIKIVKIRRRPLLKKYNSRKTKRIQQRPRKYIARSQRKKPFIYRPRPTIKKRPKPLYYQKFGQYLKKYRLRPASRQKPGQRYNQKRLIPRKMNKHKDNPKQQKGQSSPHYYFNSKSKQIASGVGKTEAPKIHEQKSLHTHIMPHPNRYLYTHIPPYSQFSNINFR